MPDPSMPQPVSRVRFPILRDFAIANYALFPGEDEKGLSADVYPGVNIIIGANGLGKTTLLNALYRVLTGPRDWKKRPPNQPAGNSPIELGAWKDDTFFRDRVPDHAAHATIKATIAFGDDQLEVTRRLGDLQITRLVVNGKIGYPDQQTYETEVVRLSGVDTFDDFFLLLRYIAFYLESRQSVLWDLTAQADILRVLFYSEAISTVIVHDARRVQQLDSQYRNRIVQLNRWKEELKQKEKALADQAEAGQELEIALARVTAAKERLYEATTAESAAEANYRRGRLELEREKVRLVEVQREQQFQEQTFYATLFPNLDSTVQYLLVHLAAGSGCLVCGSRSRSAAEHVKQALKAHQCPVCASPPPDQEQIVPAAKFSSKRLKQIEKEAEELQTHITALEAEVEEQHEAFVRNRGSLALARAERIQAEREYEQFAGVAVPNQEDVVALRQIIARETLSLRALDKQRTEIASNLREALVAGEKRSRGLSAAISKHFQAYAALFFAQDCRLEYDFVERPIGQRQGGAGMFKYPRFVAYLASGGFDTVPQPRYNANDVSESQREFADLCFRMALIAVAAEKRSAMLVLETPEASLDTAFIPRAGRLFAEFASNKDTANYLIASSNLNQTHMIPALFGIYQGEERRLVENVTEVVPPREREERVIDLLRHAKPNAAVKRYGRAYRASYNEALYPETGGKPPRKKRKS
jgi:energy-coupling factor transporter ATP-binding protein EcfA2